jgi:hypothetical protein
MKRRLHGAGPVDLVRIACAFAVAAGVEIGLRSLRLPRLCRLLGVPLDTSATPEVVAGTVVVPPWAQRRLAATRRALAHSPFGDSCLRVALVGGFMVRQLEPVLKIGVAKQGGDVRAHAWLEIGGLSLDPGSVDFLAVESADR